MRCCAIRAWWQPEAGATFKVELRLKPQVRAVRNCYCVQQYTLRVILPVVACDTACGL